ncbi:hypothetical protein D9M73_123720 [compost metagenome]
MPGRFAHEARAAARRIQIVVGEMVETRFGDCWSQPGLRLERHDQVETPASRFACSACNHTSVGPGRYADAPFVRMRRKISDDAASCCRISEQRMWRIRHLDFLEIAVRTGMIVGPQNIACLNIVDRLATCVRVQVHAVELVCEPDATECTNRASKVHMIARHEQPAAARAEPGDAFAIGGIEAIARVHRKQPQFIKG